MDIETTLDPRNRGADRLERDGYVCSYTDEAARLAELDNAVRECVAAQSLEEWQTASLIDEEDLRKCGYIDGFPNQLTIAATLDEEALEGVVRDRSVCTGDLRYQKKFLTPAACLNLYPMLAARRPDYNVVVTTLATVYRQEAQGFEGLLRLWEFKVREFVFVGNRDFVWSMLDETSTSASSLAQRKGIDVEIANASDYFYPTRENIVRQKMQEQNVMKQELVARVDGKDVAVASFNFHGTHFSRPYDFDRDNEMVTGCVGFGLHRWLAAYESAHRTQD